MQNTDTAITAPAGAETYTDPLGRTQWRVTGPAGTYLVTRSSRFDSYQVWRSDSLNTAYRNSDLQRALDKAAQYANPETDSAHA